MKTSISTNYTADGVVRKVDLYVQGMLSFNSAQVQQLSPTLSVETGGMVCAGLVKLAQKVVNTLFSFDIFPDPEWGTAVSNLLMAGNMNIMRREFEPFMESALNGVLNQLNAQDTDETPLDEQALSIQLVDWDLVGDTLRASVQLVTKADTAITIVVPVTVVP